MTERAKAKRGRVRTISRAAGFAAGGIGIAAILCALLLLLPPVRGRILGEAIVRADRVLPGRLTVREWAWPSPGEVRLGGVAWTAEADTLLSASLVEFSIGVGDLLRRDLVVNLLRAEDLEADGPRIVALFPSSPEEGVEKKRRVIPWLRAGSLEGFPSVAIRRWEVMAPRLVPAPGRTVRDFLWIMEIDLLAGGAGPLVRIDWLSGRDDGGSWSLSAEKIAVDLGRGSGPAPPGGTSPRSDPSRRSSRRPAPTRSTSISIWASRAERKDRPRSGSARGSSAKRAPSTASAPRSGRGSPPSPISGVFLSSPGGSMRSPSSPPSSFPRTVPTSSAAGSGRPISGSFRTSGSRRRPSPPGATERRSVSTSSGSPCPV
ncbi:MAG: hypothetical protein ABIK65_11760 [Candidatus Eisenbacteria bacterium]